MKSGEPNLSEQIVGTKGARHIVWSLLEGIALPRTSDSRLFRLFWYSWHVAFLRETGGCSWFARATRALFDVDEPISKGYLEC